MAAAAFASTCFLLGEQGLFFDASHYADLANQIVQNGFWAYHNDVRPYGYPLFLAVAAIVAGRQVFLFRLLVFSLQLGVYIAACWYVSKPLGAAFRIPNRGILYGILALNPFLLIASGEVLSDQLSAVLLLLGVTLSLPKPTAATPDHRSPIPDRSGLRAFFAFLALAIAVMVRPVNLVVLFAGVMIWFARAIVRRDVRSVAAVFGGGMACLLAFAPQVSSNYRFYQRPTPLISRGLYQEQLAWGIKYLKWATIIVPPYPIDALTYLNPLRDPRVESPAEFIGTRPVAYAATLALHGFAMTDQDFPFTYIRDPAPWYRWPLSLFNYALWFLQLLGIAVCWKASRTDGTRFALFSVLAVAALYVAVHLPIAVENRFSLPLYLLLAPSLACASSSLRTALNRNRRRFLVIVGAALAFIIACAELSVWLQSQAPQLRALRRSPSSPSPSISIVRLVPWKTQAGHRFQEQAIGVSAIAVEGAHFDALDKILWNGKPLVTAYGGSEFLTALVPDELIALPGDATVSVRGVKATFRIVPAQ